MGACGSFRHNALVGSQSTEQAGANSGLRSPWVSCSYQQTCQAQAAQRQDGSLLRECLQSIRVINARPLQPQDSPD